MVPRSLLSLGFAALLLAGCVTSSVAPPPPMAPPAKGAATYALVCPGPQADWPETCNFRASHEPGPKEEIWAAANPQDPGNAVVAAKDLNPESSDHCVWNGIFVTKDAGRTWTDVHIGGKFSDRKPGDPTYGYACNTDPDMAFAPDGKLYYAVEMYGYDATYALPATGTPADLFMPGGSQFLLARSDDGGLTWPSVVTAELGDGALAFHDYSRLVVSPKTGTVAYATGTYNNPGFLVGGAGGPANGAFVTVVTSHDQGATVDPPQLLWSPDRPGQLNIGTIAAAPDGTFVVSMTDINDGTVYLSTSSDDGRTFSGPVPAFKMSAWGGLPNVQFRAGSGIELAFDPHSGVLYAAWSDNATGNPDILVARSEDKGVTWGAPVRVNDDNTTHAQWMANVAVTDDGTVHVLFMDRRWDPADKLIDLTYAHSGDGGRNWTNARVTNASFDGDLGVHQSGFPFIGDYLGLSAAGNHVWGGFPDCITGTCVVAAMHATKIVP